MNPRFGHPSLAGEILRRVRTANVISRAELAERVFGAAPGSDSLVCIGVRTGLAAGVVVNGRLLNGESYTAGEISGWEVPAPYGSGRLEEVAAIPAILKDAGVEEMEKLVAAFAAGEPRVVSAVDRAARIHGWAASQISQLLDPGRIVMAGPLASLGDPYIRRVKDALVESHPAALSVPPVLMSSELGEFNGALGAAALACERWDPPR